MTFKPWCVEALQENKFQHTLTYLQKLAIKIDTEIKPCNDKEHLKQLTTTKPLLQKFLKAILKRNNKANNTKISNGISRPGQVSTYTQKGKKGTTAGK